MIDAEYAHSTVCHDGLFTGSGSGYADGAGDGEGYGFSGVIDHSAGTLSFVGGSGDGYVEGMEFHFEYSTGDGLGIGHEAMRGGSGIGKGS